MIIPTGLWDEAAVEDRLNLKIYIVETAAVSEIVSEDDSNFNSLFYEDQDLKKIVEAFQEMLIVDAVLSCKNEESLCHMMVIFKKEKESFEKIERSMTDEDFNEQNVFKVKFPKTTLSLSYISFEREITVK